MSWLKMCTVISTLLMGAHISFSVCLSRWIYGHIYVLYSVHVIFLGLSVKSKVVIETSFFDFAPDVA